MSDAPPTQTLARQLAGRWQIPLLGLSMALLLAGLWRMRPQPRPPTFAELYDEAKALANAGLYLEASAYVEHLLQDPERKPHEARRLHGLLAEIIYAHEQGNAVHGEHNAKAILEHSAEALRVGEDHTARMHRARGDAWTWLGRPVEALAEYERALVLGVEEPWPLRRTVVELRRKVGVPADELHDALDRFISAEGIDDQLRYWAAEQKVDLYGLQARHADAQRFLAEHEALFAGSAYRASYDYLQALAWYHVQRFDDAERLLRTLRDGLVPGDPLYARSGWLLGRIQQDQAQPEYALAFYDDVIGNTTPSPDRHACVLGRAEALAALERFDESVEAYRETIRLTAEHPYNPRVDLAVVRESATAWYQMLLGQGRLAEAMSFLKLAMTLVPPADDEKQAIYAARLGELALSLGRAIRARAEALDDAALQAEAKRYLTESAQAYLRLARLVSLDGARSSDATWRAAEAYDEAGDRQRTAQVLETFVRERPFDMRAPEALQRIGQTYEAMGDFESAVAWYQRCLERPRTLAAAGSLVPLAHCFIEIGEFDKAKQTLLRITRRRPDEPVQPIEPVANEYRDALFTLADLYMRSQSYEEAIATYEEALARYDRDPRADRATFMLADACQRSAARIREDLADPANVAQKDHLRATHQARLRRARALFDRVIERYRGRAEAELNALDRLYLKLSYFYRADATFDLSRIAEASDLTPYADALELYDQASWAYREDPIAMTAYVQMITCHLRLGDVAQARRRLERAKYALKIIQDERFRKFSPYQDRAWWTDYLSWLEGSGVFARVDDQTPIGGA